MTEIDHRSNKKKKKGGGFGAMGLCGPVYRAIMKMGYKMPTPIQRKAIPAILEGHDVVAMARTGSGKTGAFMIPIVERLQKHSTTVGARALVLAPTRELAMQTETFARKFSRFLDLRLCVLVGGHAIEKQFEKLAMNPDLIVATPGRLAAHLTEAAEFSLKAVQVVVFDEADRLFEMGFAEQIREILRSVPRSRQMLLMSATMPSQLAEFARAGLKDPAVIRLDAERTISDQLLLRFFFVRGDEKVACLLFTLRQIFAKGENAIVFVATRHHVEFVGRLMEKANLPAAIVYGSMDQHARTNALQRFRSGKAKALIVTDVAARGLDVPLLDQVVHFDFPASAKLFVHRSGRTARAGRKGTAVSFVTLQDLPYALELLLFLGRRLEICSDKSGAEGGSQEEKAGSGVLGGVPAELLEGDAEWVRASMREDGELASLYRSMQASYGLYYKTRPAASRESVLRAREALETVGGAERLNLMPHPALAHLAKTDAQMESERQSLLANLRSFRPSTAQGGVEEGGQTKYSVLSASTVSLMSRQKKMLNFGNFLNRPTGSGRSAGLSEEETRAFDEAVRQAEAEEENDGEEEEGEEEGDHLDDDSEGEGGEGEEDSSFLHTVTVDGQKLSFDSKGSKAKGKEKKKQEKGKGKEGAASTGKKDEKSKKPPPRVSRKNQQVSSGPDLTFIPELGEGTVMAALASKAGAPPSMDTRDVFNRKRFASKDFFLGGQKAAGMPGEDFEAEAAGARERGLAIESAQMDLLGDDEDDMKKTLSVRKWNAKKKKYQMMQVDALGKVVQEKNTKLKRNEAGVLVSGDRQKTGAYEKWAAGTRMRIQAAGEEEDEKMRAAAANKRKRAAREEDDDDDEDGDGGPMLNKMKTHPLAQQQTYKGVIEAMEKNVKMTHKMQRKAKKLKSAVEGKVTYGDDPKARADSVARTPTEVASERKKREETKTKHDPKLRRLAAKRGKEKHMRKVQEKIEKRSARPRSWGGGGDRQKPGGKGKGLRGGPKGKEGPKKGSGGRKKG